MRILITGGAGCLGSNLVEHWLPQGHDILVIDNFATGQPRGRAGRIARLTLVEGTVADRGLRRPRLRAFAPTHVIHSAASYKDPNDWREDVATNVIGTINVVEAARAARCPAVRQFPDRAVLRPARARADPGRSSMPAVHQLRHFEDRRRELCRCSDLPWVSLRLANVTGPRLAIGPIPTFYKRLKAGQSCFCTDAVRDFLDMSDFLAFMDRAIEDGAPTGVFNLGPGEGHTIQDVLSPLPTPSRWPADRRSMCGRSEPMTWRRSCLDPSKTDAAFGWRHKIQFDETIARMVRWYDQFGVSAVYSHLKAPARA